MNTKDMQVLGGLSDVDVETVDLSTPLANRCEKYNSPGGARTMHEMQSLQSMAYRD